MTRACPTCQAELSRSDWAQLWWRSSLSGGRLVRPCAFCGALLRLSSGIHIMHVGETAVLIATGMGFVLGWSTAERSLSIVGGIITLVGAVTLEIEVVPIDRGASQADTMEHMRVD